MQYPESLRVVQDITLGKFCNWGGTEIPGAKYVK